ncbi:MAG TPA: NADH-quinone oxidoreductase subunit C [Elusimicrobia bacterium]|nr:NADH-quinone oxidoreductase subunit C [Elusimicrobiota bacterium]HBT61947.1 NADH-quinone oxidoreductase subunit C [Elusimicrobiota bacterium]
MIFETRDVSPAEAFDALRGIKDQGYNVLVDMTAVDYSAFGTKPSSMGWEGNFPSGATPARAERFEVVYRLASLDAVTGLETKPRLEIHCAVGEEPVLRSIAGLWPAADWLEREIWDMFGVGFADRPDIKRLLLYESFKGHPLRKDYPINKRQPLIGPKSGELAGSPSFNVVRQEVPFE